MNQTTAMAEQQPRQTCPKRGERSKRHLRQTGRVSIAVCIYPCMYDYALYVLQEGGEKAKECQKIRNRELWLLVGEIWSHQNTRAGRLWKHSWRHQFERSFKLFILFFCGTSFFCFWEFWSQLGSRQRSRLWTLRASGINKLLRSGRSTKSLWVSNRALFIVFCLLFVYCLLLFIAFCFVFCFFVFSWGVVFFWFVFFCFLIVCFS